MSSELQSQISAIRKQHIQAAPLHQGRPSLFLTPQEAAAVDVRTVYDAAVSGLSTLRQYDARLESFFDNLLHPSSVDVQRELKTVEENKQIDDQVAGLLRLLSLFAHNPESHLVLEYLIRRFRIHEMNTDALLKCMLVTHDTKIFARVVQLCNIEGNVWEFLSGVKKSGSPLPRSIIVQRATRDSSLLDVLCQIVQSALDAATSQSLNVTSNSQVEIIKGADRVLSFFTATVVEMAEERAFDDSKMRSIYVFLLEGLRQKKGAQLYLNGGEIIEQWRRASCMILVQLCRKTSFAKPLMKSLSSALADAFVQCSSSGTGSKATKLSGEMLSAMIILAQHQKIKISAAFLLKLFVSSDKTTSDAVSGSGAVFIKLFTSLSVSYDVSTLSSEITSALAYELTFKRNKADTVSTNDLLNLSDAVKITLALIAAKVVDISSLRGLLVRLFQQVTDAKASLYSLPELRQAYLEVIRQVSQQYPVEFDQCIKEVTVATSAPGEENAGSELLHRFLKDLFADKQYRLPDGQGVGLLLSLSSAIPQVRIQATKTFSESIALHAESTPDVVGICTAALNNLSDQDEEVAVAAWKSKVVSRIAEHVAPVELFEALQQAVTHWSSAVVKHRGVSGSVKTAGKVLVHILQSLREETVLKALTSADKDDSSSSISWLFGTLVSLSAGALSARYHVSRGDKGAETEFSSLFLTVQQEAVSSASVSAHHLPILKGLKIKEDASSESIVENLVKVIGKNTSSDAEVQTLSDLVSSVLESLHHEKDLGTSSTVLSLLLAVIGEINTSSSASKKGSSASSAKVVKGLLSAVCPLLLLTVETADKTSDSVTQIADHVKSFLSHHAAVSSAASSAVTGLESFIRSVTQPLSSSDPVTRVLVKLLESRHASLLSLVGLCISSSSSSHPAEVLLRIALTDSHASKPDAVPVSPSVRAAAIQGLSTFVASIAARPLTPPHHSLSVSDSVALMVLLPLAIASCSDSHDLLRRAGLSLAKRITTALNAKGTLSLDKESKSRLTKALGDAHSDILVSDVIAVAKVLTDREGTIAMDPHAASAALVSEVFHAGQSSHHAHSHIHLQHLCYWMVMEFGWSVPRISQSVASLASSASIEHSWKFVSYMLNSISSSGTSSNAAAEAVCKSLVRCLTTFSTASDKTKTDIVQWIASSFSASSSLEGLSAVVRTSVLELFSRGTFDSISESQKAALYSALVKEQLVHPGNADVLQAIASLQVNVQQPLKLLKEGLDSFAEAFKKLVKSSSSSSSSHSDSSVDDGNALMQFDDAEDNPQLVGMSAPLQKLSALLEAVVPSIHRVTEAQAAELGVIAVLLLDSLELVNHPSLKSVMIVEFTKALIIDAAFRCLSVAGKHIMASPSSASDSSSSCSNKTPKKGSKSGSSADSLVIDGVSYEVYRISRVEKDVHILLNCLGSAKLSQVQNSALNLLHTLISINPASIFSSIRVLGELLSTSAAAVQLGREGLVENILRAFVSLMPKEDVAAVAGSQGTFVVQEVLQSLCERYQFMPHYRRSALTKLALKTLRSDESLLAGITVLLSHAYTSYETIGSTSVAVVNTNENVNTANGPSGGQPLLLLSKSAHRKANRELRTSTPEEFFALAVEVLVGRSPATQIKSVVSVLKVTKELLEQAFGAEEEEKDEEEAPLAVSVDKLQNYCSHVLSLRNKQSSALEGSHGKNAVEDHKRGHAATLAVLHLEYVLEILENKQFHQVLVMAVDANQESASSIQNHFLELADFILQLQTLSSSVVQGLGSFSKRLEPILIRLESSNLRLSPKALSLQINSWCYEAIKVLQRLVDGPTFVTILQELISHEQIEVRQKALIILGERLEGMTNSTKNSVEINLYLDLNTTLRQVIQDLMPALKPSSKGSNALSSEDQHRNIGLAQSALMCIDVLAKFLARKPEWVKDLVETLSEVMGLIAALTALTEPQKSSSSSSSKSQKTSIDSTVEYLKLHGSAFLCSGTLCGQLGPKALGQLSVLVTNHLNCLESHGAVLLNTDTSSLSTTAEADELSLFKTRALFVRSILSSLTVIINEIPSFVHPYIQRTLTVSLRLHGVSHIREIETDVDRCLSAIASKIPPRLSVPALLETTPVVLSTGHNAAGRFAELLAEVWINLDRNTVKAHLNSLSRIATLLLDYRRAFGDQSEEGDEVDDLVADAVVELCLKLTETELKTFLNSLAEWRDIATSNDSEGEEWRQHSRSVSFYALVESLSDKLKHLFLPSMGLLWTNAAELLGEFTGVVTAATTAAAAAASAGGEDNKKQKKEKKRKHEEHTEDPSSTAGTAAGSKTVQEVTALARKILSCVKLSCNNDTTDNFLDDQRFELMMPAVVSLIVQRAAFADDDSFLSFGEEYLTPCLTALAVNIAKDVLWKPLNHKVLLATRDKRKAVRMLSVKTLHQLFSEVGEEYLMLLPECLPFLSELMEDDAREVTSLTSDTIRFLEELSGEKLDHYLQ